MEREKETFWSAVQEADHAPFWFGFLLVILSVHLLYSLDPHDPWLKVCLTAGAEVGFALIIAFMLSVTLERQYKKEYNKFVTDKVNSMQEYAKQNEEKMSKNIFDYVYGNRVDRKLFQIVEDSILKEKFYKRENKVYYEIGEIVDGWVSVGIEFEFVVENISSDDGEYDLNCFYEKPLLETGAPDALKSGVAVLYVDGQKTQSEIDDADKNTEDDENFKRFNVRVPIRCGERKSIKIKTYIRKMSCDSDFWRTVNASDGVTALIR
ncbi:MAG: hypothetical protein LCH39_09025 [Proteobacteria bacterium]|nr:hypothetical protein [Pseudomonadota bacterium]